MAATRAPPPAHYPGHACPHPPRAEPGAAGAAAPARADAARIAPAPACCLWQGPRDRYVALDGEPLAPLAARSALLRRYFAAFGPATVRDAASWTGLRIRDVRAALPGAEPLVRHTDEAG